MAGNQAAKFNEKCNSFFDQKHTDSEAQYLIYHRRASKTGNNIRKKNYFYHNQKNKNRQLDNWNKPFPMIEYTVKLRGEKKELK